MLPSLVVFGDRTANEVVEAANLDVETRFGKITKLFFDEKRFLTHDRPEIERISSEVYFNVGIVDLDVRCEIQRLCFELNWIPFSVIHPSAVISATAKIGIGVFIGPLVVASTNAQVGDFSIVHIHSSIGHDAVIGDTCTILPGARISGSVHIGNRVLIGSNAFVSAGVTIEDDCQVDALTYVNKNLKGGHIQSVRSPGAVRRIDMK